SNGRGHFVFVTNLAPCSGVRIHLWPEKHRSSIENEVPASKRIVEVTSKMVHIPAGPAPKQVEPGSQTEQPPPSAFLLLSPEDMNGYNFMTISVASRQTFVNYGASHLLHWLGILYQAYTLFRISILKL
uniref:Uncharacterized protein n=1 Tax=Aegilops tauschii subsp. strangulata TaxID=200361 RepID=A0A453KIL7_AEGTS